MKQTTKKNANVDWEVVYKVKIVFTKQFLFFHHTFLCACCCEMVHMHAWKIPGLEFCTERMDESGDFGDRLLSSLVLAQVSGDFSQAYAWTIFITEDIQESKAY